MVRRKHRPFRSNLRLNPPILPHTPFGLSLVIIDRSPVMDNVLYVKEAQKVVCFAGCDLTNKLFVMLIAEVQVAEILLYATYFLGVLALF